MTNEKTKQKKTLPKIVQPLLVLVGLIVILSVLSPSFLTMSNLMNVLRQVSVNGMIAAGLTLVILTGGIDLSVGSILAFSGAVTALLLQRQMPLAVALVAGLGVGVVFGLVNGTLVTRAKVQPFIGTLVSMMFLRGATLVLTDGKPIAIPREGNEMLNWFGRGDIFGIPVPMILTLIVFAVLYYVLSQTRYGRHLYAVGGNEKAARLAGVDTKKTQAIAYLICGITAFMAGVIVTSRLSSAQPTAGEGYEMDAIAAVVLGGTSMTGGQGTIPGTLIGVLIMGVLNNALNLMNVPSYYQQIAKAVIILIAVLLDRKKQAE
ncbi:MAG: ribose ABC transporter permease [Peptoniphilaceae bacterium]|nr:ribose ABC transporter permease [Peptoniphilaceae bacterium]MDY6086211.1 ribose ABC transporter permease [Peptoniphilaceae bacterium]